MWAHVPQKLMWDASLRHVLMETLERNPNLTKERGLPVKRHICYTLTPSSFQPMSMRDLRYQFMAMVDKAQRASIILSELLWYWYAKVVVFHSRWRLWQIWQSDNFSRSVWSWMVRAWCSLFWDRAKELRPSKEHHRHEAGRCTERSVRRRKSREFLE